jgi:hypothetical protein
VGKCPAAKSLPSAIDRKFLEAQTFRYVTAAKPLPFTTVKSIPLLTSDFRNIQTVSFRSGSLTVCFQNGKSFDFVTAARPFFNVVATRFVS